MQATHIVLPEQHHDLKRAVCRADIFLLQHEHNRQWDGPGKPWPALEKLGCEVLNDAALFYHDKTISRAAHAFVDDITTDVKEQETSHVKIQAMKPLIHACVASEKLREIFLPTCLALYKETLTSENNALSQGVAISVPAMASSVWRDICITQDASATTQDRVKIADFISDSILTAKKDQLDMPCGSFLSDTLLNTYATHAIWQARHVPALEMFAQERMSLYQNTHDAGDSTLAWSSIGVLPYTLAAVDDKLLSILVDQWTICAQNTKGFPPEKLLMQGSCLMARLGLPHEDQRAASIMASAASWSMSTDDTVQNQSIHGTQSANQPLNESIIALTNHEGGCLQRLAEVRCGNSFESFFKDKHNCITFPDIKAYSCTPGSLYRVGFGYVAQGSVMKEWMTSITQGDSHVMATIITANPICVMHFMDNTTSDVSRDSKRAVLSQAIRQSLAAWSDHADGYCRDFPARMAHAMRMCHSEGRKLATLVADRYILSAEKGDGFCDQAGLSMGNHASSSDKIKLAHNSCIFPVSDEENASTIIAYGHALMTYGFNDHNEIRKSVTKDMIAGSFFLHNGFGKCMELFLNNNEHGRIQIARDIKAALLASSPTRIPSWIKRKELS